jgi:tetrahydromethanopterin S-methyltransferase subunit B
MKKTLAAAILLAATAGATAQDANRYTLQKTADGYVRLNNATGEMSICKEQADQLICRVAADDRVELEEAISQLEVRVAKMEEKLASIETSGVTSNNSLPTDEEFEKTVGYMEKFFRRFMGVVKELNQDETQPNKT